MRRSFLFVAVVLLGSGTTTSGCLGSNDDIEPLAAKLARYPDKGRRAVDPITTPGYLTITFDDGPGIYTKHIVDVLDQHKAKGTFFCIGRLIPGQRDVLDYVQDHGHQLANHSYNHEAQPSLDEVQFKERVSAVQKNIGILDSGRLYFRFPFGAAGDDQLRWLSELSFEGRRYRAVGWHLDSEDFDFNQTYPAAPQSKNILDDENVEGDGTCDGQPNPFTRDFVGWTQFIARKVTGGIMLFHDTKQITSDHLDEILTGFEDPAKYWASVNPPERRAELERYYNCQKVDKNFKLELQPLWTGVWPSFFIDEQHQ